MSDEPNEIELSDGRAAYRVRCWIEKDEDAGGYCVYAPDLPGCASCGETLNECLENIKEAAAGCIESYLADGVDIPWVPVSERKQRPDFNEERVIIASVYVTTKPTEIAR